MTLTLVGIQPIFIMDTLTIIEKYYKKDSDLYNILVGHSMDVMRKSLEIATNHPELDIDIEFLCQAAMLHDIGINMTYAPGIECFGVMPYLCHGYLGREILDNENLPKHALVCERHTGVGLSAEDITKLSLPLPVRDMIPVSIEEEIICFADCFFSKTRIGEEKSLDKIRREIAQYTHKDAVAQFNLWCEKFL